MDSSTIGAVIILCYVATIAGFLVYKGFQVWDKELDLEDRRIQLKENKQKNKDGK